MAASCPPGAGQPLSCVEGTEAASSPELLIANRGEIALRIIRAAADLGFSSVAIYAEDDARALHVRFADDAPPLERTGVAAYLDGPGILAVARKTGAGWLHPGYGFLAENPGFARACADAGMRFVGPRPVILEPFGDKVRARAAAGAAGLSVLRGSPGPCTVEEARMKMEHELRAETSGGS